MAERTQIARKVLLLVLAAVVVFVLYRLIATGAEWPNSRGLIAGIFFVVMLIVWPAARRAGHHLRRLWRMRGR